MATVPPVTSTDDDHEAREEYDHTRSPASEESIRIRERDERRQAADAQSTASSIPPDGGLWGWLRVLAAWLLMLTAWGPSQTFGTFQAYYLTDFLSNKTASEISWIGSVSTLLLITSGAFAGPLFDRGFLKPLMCLGCFLEVLGMMMLSISNTYAEVFLSQAICIGLGSGLVFVPALAFVVNSFQKNRAIAVGVTTTGTSVGGIIFPILFRKVLPQTSFGWTCRAFGLIQLVCNVVGLAIIMSAPVRKTKPRRLFEIGALRSLPFDVFLVTSFCSFLAFWVPLFYIPSYATSVLGATPEFGSYLTVILNGGSVFGRVLPSLLMGRLGAGNITSFCTSMAAMLLFVWVAVSSLKGFIVWCVFFGFFTGVLVSGFPMLVSHPLISPDMRTIGTRIGMLYFGGGLGALVGNPIAGVLLGRNGDYTSVQVFAASMMAACALGLWFVTFSVRRYDRRELRENEKAADDL